MTAMDDPTGPTAGGAARGRARAAGALWLVVIVAGLFAEMVVRAHLLVRDDGAATASRVLQNEGLFRLGFVSDVVATACYLAVVAILFDVLAPAGRTLSSVAAAFGVAGSAIAASSLAGSFAPLTILLNADHLPGFAAEQLHSLALLQLKLYRVGSSVSFIFFSGVYLSLIGVLVVKARFLPSILGLLLALAGACYLFGSLSSLLAPAFAARLGAAIYLPGLVAELAITLWLLARGVNAAAWEAQAATSR